MNTEPKWAVEIGNEVDRDEGYHEFYRVSGPTMNFRCDYGSDAKWLADLLNKIDPQ